MLIFKPVRRCQDFPLPPIVDVNSFFSCRKIEDYKYFFIFMPSVVAEHAIAAFQHRYPVAFIKRFFLFPQSNEGLIEVKKRICVSRLRLNVDQAEINAHRQPCRTGSEAGVVLRGPLHGGACRVPTQKKEPESLPQRVTYVTP